MSIARGPNELNLAEYTQGRGQTIPYDPNELQQQMEHDTLNMEQQFDNHVQKIQKYDEILAKIAKNIDEVSAEEHFITDFYPQFAVNCTYEHDHEKVIVNNSDLELAKVIDNLERNNRNLKEEMKGWLFEYAKKTRLSEVLLTQNKLLRKYVSAKNKNLVKLIETISSADNQELNSLNEDLNELKEENGVLLDHLKQLKNTLLEKQDEERKIVDAYKAAELRKLGIQAQIQKGEDEEQHYSKTASLLEASIEQLTRREKKLQQQKERLMNEKKTRSEEHNLIQKQIDNCKIDRSEIDKHLKAKFKDHQNQKETLLNEIDDLNEKIGDVKKETKNLEMEIAKNQFRNDEYANICIGLDKKCEEVSEGIRKIQEEHQSLKEGEVKCLTKIEVIDFDIDVLQEELKELQEVEQQNREKYKKELKDLQISNSEELSQWNQEYKKTQSKISKAVMQQKSNLMVAKREIEDWEHKVEDKKTEIDQLRQQLIEIKENQKELVQLKQQLKEAQKR